MATSKIEWTESTLSWLDRLVKEKKYPNRSRAIQKIVEDKITRLEKNRLAVECNKLDPEEEKAFSEEGMNFEVDRDGRDVTPFLCCTMRFKLPPQQSSLHR